MWRLAIIVMVAFCALGMTALSAQEAPPRIALLIGNQNYTDKVGPLNNPHRDAALIEAALERLGFKVTVVRDASYRDMNAALKRHVAEVRKAAPGAISFFYYSGHGVANPDTQINYLVPVDIADANAPSLWTNAFEQSEVIEKLSRQAPQAIHYVVFDACRNELRLSSLGQKALGADKGFVPIAQTAGLLIAYSTGPKQTASDGGYGGGPYARVLAEEMVKPGAEAVTMFRNVQLKVKQAVGQDPWLSFPSLPEVYLAGREMTAPKPSVLASSILGPIRVRVSGASDQSVLSHVKLGVRDGMQNAELIDGRDSARTTHDLRITSRTFNEPGTQCAWQHVRAISYELVDVADGSVVLRDEVRGISCLGAMATIADAELAATRAAASTLVDDLNTKLKRGN